MLTPSATTPHLLDDTAMQRFIVDGFHRVNPDEMALPATFHTAVADKLAKRFEDTSGRDAARGALNDALLRELPELRQLFDDPAVNGALTSVLGRDWSLHSHSYAHDRFPTSNFSLKDEMMHRDGGFVGCYDGLVTRQRWMLLLYYPQAVADDFGPTETVPATQYLFENPLPDPTVRGTPLTTRAPGTLVITSYELWHRATHNRAPVGRGPRFMLKFMAGRLCEPEAGKPSWKHDVSRRSWPAGAERSALRSVHVLVWR
jgi:hypothetical protein